MDDISPASLKCSSCGHTWTARSNNPKSPQCSKCRSREIEQIGRIGATNAANVEGSSSTPPQPVDVTMALNRMARQFKDLIHHLQGINVMDDETFYSQLITFCPYCKGANRNGMEYSEETDKWTCRRCGAIV